MNWRTTGRTALAGLFSFVALVSGTALADGEKLVPQRPVPLMYDPGFSNLRVPPPAQARVGGDALQALGATITINYRPAGAGQFGDTCGTWDPAAQAAFTYAANIWGALVQSAVPITIDACWASNLSPGVLGHAGANGYWRDFAGTPAAGVYFPIALRNALTGVDNDPAGYDIYAGFSSTFTWYFGTDGIVPFGKVDFVSVVLHEIGHGLGFSGSMDVTGSPGTYLGTWGFGGFPLTYDRFAENGALQSLLNLGLFPQNSAALGTALTSGSVFFNGANAKAANGGTHVPLYAPATWSGGSSFSHLAESYNGTANALMTYSLAGNESIHDPGPVTLGILKDLGWTLAAPVSADVQLTQAVSPAAVTAGKDVMYTMTVKNNGPDAATSVQVIATLPAAATFVWASTGCVYSLGSLTCDTASLANQATVVHKVVVRPTLVGTATNDAAVASAVADPSGGNNHVTINATVTAAAAAVQVQRYRLYSDVTKEHHFTTDLNEYNVLGTYVGTWVQEGTVGKVLNNPGSFNAVVAVPYYRLYNTVDRWHHWTTDANEYYTLIQFPGWNGEGVDGYILPSATTGTVQLFRLNYPALGALHHWTIDANEYNTLITPAYGWVGEGGSGFVIQ